MDEHSSPERRPIEIAVAAMLLVDLLRGSTSRWLSTLWLKVILRWVGCPYGRRLQADGWVVVRVRYRGAITIGQKMIINSRFLSNLVGMTGPTIFHCIRNGRIRIGDNSGCSATVFSARNSIVVGDNVRIGGNVRIYDHDFHSVDYLDRRDPEQDFSQEKSAPVVIGNDVLIGAYSIILKGVTVGDRSVIGAGSVVSLKEIPPDSLVAGNPARIIRSLRAEKP